MRLKEIMDKHLITAQELSFEARIPRTTILYIIKQEVFNPKYQVALKLIEGVNRIANTSYNMDNLK